MVARIDIAGVPREFIVKLRHIRTTMIQRCYDNRGVGWRHYGNRGIRVCDEWLASREAFISWAASAGYRPGLHIDRIDSDGNYEPGNCRWVTPEQNLWNRRKFRPDLSASKYKGVGPTGHLSKPWRADIRRAGVRFHIGTFVSEKEAAQAYDSRAIELFGEFARLNFPT